MDGDLWPRVERAAAVIMAVAGAIGGCAEAAKAIIEYREARKTAKTTRMTHGQGGDSRSEISADSQPM
jgi:hypothetical protein